MDRLMFTSSTPGAVSGDDYMDNVAEKVGSLFNAMTLKPTAVANAGNDYTITVDPVLTGDAVVGGMSFLVKPNVNNTGTVRMRVGAAGTYYNVVKSTGEALAAGDFASDTAYFVAFLDGEFRILSVAAASGGGGAHAYYQEFLVSGTWTKPVDLSPDAVIMVEVWGGGAGGNSSGWGGGGGGGAYAFDFLRASDLTSSVSITIGAGGAVNTAGGNSSFGSYATAFGGGTGGAGGSATTVGAGGGGGGATSAGANASGVNGATGGAGGNGGSRPLANGLIAMTGSSANSGAANYGGGGGGGGGTGQGHGGDAIWGGGGGGNGASGAGNGGSSIYGGAGGGGVAGVGGSSLYGGNGGNTGVAGSVPGGGGGRNAVGGAGKCIVRVVG